MTHSRLRVNAVVYSEQHDRYVRILLLLPRGMVQVCEESDPLRLPLPGTVHQADLYVHLVRQARYNDVGFLVTR